MVLQFEILSFVFGLCVGSFLNVCIYRLPVSKSIVYPGSACPLCGNMIRFYDNIPVVSYILLRGKCRYCSSIISPRYAYIELMTGFFSYLMVLKFGITLEALIYFTFIVVLIVITFIDIDHRIIPDMISLPGIPVFFAASFILPEMSWMDSLIGILTGGGSLFLVAYVYTLITKIDGMGGGDIKLLAMIGAVVGLQGVIFTILLSSAVGTIYGLTVMLKSRKNMKLAVPFGPFLSIGAATYIFYGPQLIYWYYGILV